MKTSYRNREASVQLCPQAKLSAADDAEIPAKLDASKNEVIRLIDPERAICVKASQSVLDKHRKELDPKALC